MVLLSSTRLSEKTSLKLIKTYIFQHIEETYILRTYSTIRKLHHASLPAGGKPPTAAMRYKQPMLNSYIH